MVWDSNNQRWFDGNTEDEQEQYSHIDEHLQGTSTRLFLWWTRKCYETTCCETGWSTATPLVEICGSGQRKCYSIYLHLPLLNSYILVSACGWKKISQRPLEKPASTNSSIARMDSSGNKHWPVPLKQLWCCLC